MNNWNLLLNKVMTKTTLLPLLEEARQLGHSVVFTNGCFDILHMGHVNYLAAAKDQGDFLVIGLNSDASVRRLKGSSRPVNSEEQRAAVLASLQMVDAVILFEEDTPLQLITAIRPDVLVKGGDYSINTIVGAEEVQGWGGDVKVLPFVDGLSTTQIINKLQNGKN